METIGLTDPEWQRMDGAVSTEPAAIDPRDVDSIEDVAEPRAGQGPATASFVREHAGSLVGSVLFVGGLLWLLQQGALPVVPPAGAWVGVLGWAVALYLVAFVVVHLLRCARWGLLIAEGGIPAKVKAAYLTNSDIIRLADYAAWVRRTRASGRATDLRSVA